MPNSPTPDLYSIIVDMNGRLGQSLQMGADTKDSVDKIKDVQAKSVTEQTQYYALLQEQMREHIELAKEVASHDTRIKILEHSHIEKKAQMKILAIMGGLVGSVLGFILGHIDKIAKWLGF